MDAVAGGALEGEILDDSYRREHIELEIIESIFAERFNQAWREKDGGGSCTTGFAGASKRVHDSVEAEIRFGHLL